MMAIFVDSVLVVGWTMLAFVAVLLGVAITQ